MNMLIDYFLFPPPSFSVFFSIFIFLSSSWLHKLSKFSVSHYRTLISDDLFHVAGWACQEFLVSRFVSVCTCGRREREFYIGISASETKPGIWFAQKACRSDLLNAKKIYQRKWSFLGNGLRFGTIRETGIFFLCFNAGQNSNLCNLQE